MSYIYFQLQIWATTTTKKLGFCACSNFNTASTPTSLLSSFTCQYCYAPLVFLFVILGLAFIINLINFVFILLLCAKLEDILHECTFSVRYCPYCTQKTRCGQVTKTHVIDFDQSRAWTLYSERRS